MSYGFVAPVIETEEQGKAHVLGSTNLSENIILPSGDWTEFLPDREPQSKNGVETFACTVYGTESAIETQLRFYGIKDNYSDRYVANVAKNIGVLNPQGGANPHDIAEVIRSKSGNLSEETLPFSENIRTSDQYYSVDTNAYIPEGVQWYKKWRVKHKWVFLSGTPEEKRAKLQEALTKGTVCVSVYAWQNKKGLYVKPQGATDNHWVQLVSAKDNEPYVVFDSYDSYVNTLDPNYDFGYAKVYFVSPAHTFLKNLYYGQIDKEVAELQKALTFLGYSIPNSVTEIYGNQTKTAIKQFQENNGILDDGSNFGPKTRLAMNRTLNPTTGLAGLITTIRTYLGV
jgi:hypothetical protein